MRRNLTISCLSFQKQVDKLKQMLEKPDVISALNNGGSGKSKKCDVTWSYILRVSKIS